MPDPTPRRNAIGRAGGSAVSSGTSAFGLPILRGSAPTPPPDVAAFDGLDLPVGDAAAAKPAADAPRMRAVAPDAASFDGLDLPTSEPQKSTVVGPITDLIRRCRQWFADGEKTRRRAQPAEPTPRSGTAIIGPRAEAVRQRAVADAARRLAEATAIMPRPLPRDPRERIIEKRRLMLELKQQRDDEAREALDVTIVRRPRPSNRPPGA